VNVAGWLRGHPRLGEVMMAAALLAFSVPQVAFGAGDAPVSPSVAAPIRAPLATVTVVLAATVIARRRYPVAALGVAAAIGAAQVAFGVQHGTSLPVFALQPTNADVAILVLLYIVAAHRPRRVSIAALVLCLAGSAVAIARWAPAHSAYAGYLES